MLVTVYVIEFHLTVTFLIIYRSKEVVWEVIYSPHLPQIFRGYLNIFKTLGLGPFATHLQRPARP